MTYTEIIARYPPDKFWGPRKEPSEAFIRTSREKAVVKLSTNRKQGKVRT